MATQKMFVKSIRIVTQIVENIAKQAAKELNLRHNINQIMSKYSFTKAATSINQLTTTAFSNHDQNNKFVQQPDPSSIANDNMTPQIIQISIVQKSKDNSTSRITDSYRTNRGKNKRSIQNVQNIQKSQTYIQQKVSPHKYKQTDHFSTQTSDKKKQKVQISVLNNHNNQTQKQEEIVQKFRQRKIQQQNQKQLQLNKKKNLLGINKKQTFSFDYEGKPLKVNQKAKSNLISLSTDARSNRNSVISVKKSYNQIQPSKVKSYKIIKNQQQNANTYTNHTKIRIRPKRQNEQQQIILDKYENYQLKSHADPSVWLMQSPINKGIKITFEKRTYENLLQNSIIKNKNIKEVAQSMKSRRLSKLEYNQLRSVQKKYSQRKQTKKNSNLKTSESQQRLQSQNDHPNPNPCYTSTKKISIKKQRQFRPLTIISKSEKIIVNNFNLKTQLIQNHEKEWKEYNMKINNMNINCSSSLCIQSKIKDISKQQRKNVKLSENTTKNVINKLNLTYDEHNSNSQFVVKCLEKDNLTLTLTLIQMKNQLIKQSKQLQIHPQRAKKSILINCKDMRKRQFMRSIHQKVELRI